MYKYIIDENLPYYFKLWHNNNYIHVYDLPEISTDEEIWSYAKNNNLIIVSKDSDFSNKIMFASPPPKVIHIKIGNMKIADLYKFLNRIWPSLMNEIEKHKLVNVYLDRIESFE
jgi:predicted nuclease of predicted toxin-antitoxin system